MHYTKQVIKLASRFNKYAQEAAKSDWTPETLTQYLSGKAINELAPIIEKKLDDDFYSGRNSWMFQPVINLEFSKKQSIKDGEGKYGVLLERSSGFNNSYIRYYISFKISGQSVSVIFKATSNLSEGMEEEGLDSTLESWVSSLKSDPKLASYNFTFIGSTEYNARKTGKITTRSMFEYVANKAESELGPLFERFWQQNKDFKDVKISKVEKSNSGWDGSYLALNTNNGCKYFVSISIRRPKTDKICEMRMRNSTPPASSNDKTNEQYELAHKVFEGWARRLNGDEKVNDFSFVNVSDD